MENQNTPAVADKPAASASVDTIQRLVLGGDLSKMDAKARVTYYIQLCESLKLNPYTQPFQILRLSGKEVLYATKSCTEQLRKQNKVSVTKLEHRTENGLMVVTCSVKDKTGRTDASTGAVVIENMKGEALANAYMKCETKAKRRATLSICGLGMMDESELDTIKDAETVPMPPLPTEQETSAEVVQQVPAQLAEPVAEATPVVLKAEEAKLQKLVQLIASPELDEEERAVLLAVPVDQRPATWVENTLAKLPSVVQERKDPKKALEAAQKQLRTAAARHQKDMPDSAYQAIILRAGAITAKPAELRAEARALLAQFQLQPA
ncbi:hypothetical protein K3G63_11065 [Hymenobacter sp. HSC-4F20]|uniref:hypothetical protein n=1 Tax=Hymenobacter sp. HSC-4F20 TaxID=2864135 RepID=UPI001C73B6DA|nr:hypothetical protein [Hymenobacter sp. HSC-4F20]MBX0290983.1 hypothetical protein [Hymenobacter sp. HSC-4F20]